MRNKKAIVMYSGGADSTLAIRMLQAQDIECVAVNVQIPFYDISGGGCAGVVDQSELDGDTPLLKISLGDEYLQMMRNPKYGFGKAINPCRDCHIMMLKAGKKLMHEYGASFVATGEVVGQRPNSQMFRHLGEVERDSGLLGRLLRPLSAKLLTPTIPEMQGIVDRSKLADIQGRKRTRQHEMAKELGYKLPGSGGGCVLTEQEFAKKVRDLYDHCDGDHPPANDAGLLRVGRHLRWSPDYKIVIAKDENQSLLLEQYPLPGDLLFNFDTGVLGPFALVRGNVPEKDYQRLAALVLRYCKVPKSVESEITLTIDGVDQKIVTNPMNPDEVKDYIL